MNVEVAAEMCWPASALENVVAMLRFVPASPWLSSGLFHALRARLPKVMDFSWFKEFGLLALVLGIERHLALSLNLIKSSVFRVTKLRFLFTRWNCLR
jgi:hypothetical protein